MANASNVHVLVIGSFITDLVFRVDRYPAEGETLIGHTFNRFPGGKGANQAVAARRLGAAVSMVGRLGMDLFGDEQLQGFAAAGIDTSGVTRDPDAPSGVATITIDREGRNRIVIVPGANMRVTVDDIERSRQKIAAADILMLQLEIPLACVAQAVEIASQSGTPVILNPAPAQPLPRDIFPKVSVLTPNEVEAEQLTGIPVRSVEDAAAAARRLLDWGVKAVVITLGARGALVQAAGDAQPTLIEAFEVQAVDTVAAGDAFNGALAVRLAEGAPLVEAARYAAAAAAISVTRPGAQPSMPRREEVEAFLRNDRG